MIECRTIKELCSVVVDCPHSTPTWTVEGKIVVRSNNIKNGRIDFSSPSYTDDEHFQQRIKRATPQGGDIIITREAPMGEVGMIPEGIVCCLGQRMVLLRANPEICDNYYLLYSLQSRYVQHQISWSDNADPTWQQGHLSDLVTVRYGKDHKKLADGIYPVYGSGGIMRHVERPLYDKESVLIPRKGTLNNVMYVNQPFWSVDTMFYTEMRLPDVAKFVYHFVKAKDLAAMNAGSAVPSMTTDILNAMEIAIPPATVLEEFESLVAPMYRAMQGNDAQSKKLADLRNALLPKLMSGEIDVSDIQL